MSSASKYYAAPVIAGAITGVPAAPGILGGFTLRNTAASACQVDIYDNASSGTGNLLLSVDLTAAGTVGASQTFLPDGTGGIRYFKGLFMVKTGTGTPQGSIFIA